MSDKSLVYLLLYNPMIYQSGWITQGVYKRRERAYDAMEEQIKLAKEKWEEDHPSEKDKITNPFGKYEDWRITPMVIED